MDIEKIIRERKEQARRMRRTVAVWVINGISDRQARREYERISEYEEKTKLLEELMIEGVGRVVNKIGFV